MNRYTTELTEKDNRIFFLSIHADSPSAYVQLLIQSVDNDLDLANGKDIAHIHDLRVRSDMQSKGHGRSLVAYIEEQVHKKGITTLTLGVDSPNARAIRFYEKLGYMKFKDTPGRTDDERCYYMRKTLN